MTKAVLLFSGGLDSLLAAHILRREGIALEAVYFHTVFSSSTLAGAKDRLSRALMPLEVPLILKIGRAHV